VRVMVKPPCNVIVLIDRTAFCLTVR